ncbi:MAG: FtsX-like permease family protein, partial [Patescibacteria group bacterium]
DYVGDAGGLIESFKQVQFIVNVVGSVVVAASLFIIVYIDAARKRRQIGILRAIGIRHTIIVYSYLLQSLFYAIAAMGLGLLFIFYVLEPYIAAHPLPTTTGAVRMAISQIGLIHSILILLGAAFIGGIIPAWKAARENIIDAIWGA